MGGGGLGSRGLSHRFHWWLGGGLDQGVLLTKRARVRYLPNPWAWTGGEMKKGKALSPAIS